MPPLGGLHSTALGLCCNWYEHAPTSVLDVFAALTHCARSDVGAFDTITLRYVHGCSLV